MKQKMPFILFWLLMIGSYNIQAQKDESKGQRKSDGFEYEDCGCEYGVNLRIFHGLNGHEIGENDEETKGAITVANKNGDNGGNEIDLMKLIIEPTGIGTGTCIINIEYEANIVFWSNSDKTGAINSPTFSSDDLPKTIWIEAINVSEDVKDIEIEARIGNTIHDKVVATALWCTFVNKYTSGNTPSPALIADPPLPEFINNFKDTDGNIYGLGYFNNSNGHFSYGGRILIELDLYPKGVENLWPLYFDVTRRISKTREGIRSGAGSFSLLESKSFPTNPELPNDDGISNDDEDNIPDRFFGYDGPSEPIHPELQPGQNSYAFMKSDHEFEEFVRMSFEPLAESGNTLYGSRCSDKIPWVHNRCLQLWSDDLDDPYSPTNQRYKVLEGPVTHSIPTRYLGIGNGEIIISLQSNSITEGYTIAIQDNEIAELYNSSSLVSSVEKSNGGWVLVDNGKIMVNINDNNTNPYLAMDRIFFSVLVDSAIFNNIKIE